MPLYNAILDSAGGSEIKWARKTFFAMPNGGGAVPENITVHALGGCRRRTARLRSDAPSPRRCQVFGYKSLYVADGSIVPTALGANPSPRSRRCSERVAEG